MNRRITSVLASAALLLAIAGGAIVGFHSKGWNGLGSDAFTAISGLSSETEVVEDRTVKQTPPTTANAPVVIAEAAPDDDDELPAQS